MPPYAMPLPRRRHYLFYAAAFAISLLTPDARRSDDARYAAMIILRLFDACLLLFAAARCFFAMPAAAVCCFYILPLYAPFLMPAAR